MGEEPARTRALTKVIATDQSPWTAAAHGLQALLALGDVRHQRRQGRDLLVWISSSLKEVRVAVYSAASAWVAPAGPSSGRAFPFLG